MRYVLANCSPLIGNPCAGTKRATSRPSCSIFLRIGTAVAAPHADLRQPIEDGGHRRRCVLLAILLREGVARRRVLREVMIELRDLTERRRTRLPIVDDVRDQL